MRGKDRVWRNRIVAKETVGNFKFSIVQRLRETLTRAIGQAIGQHAQATIQSLIAKIGLTKFLRLGLYIADLRAGHARRRSRPRSRRKMCRIVREVLEEQWGDLSGRIAVKRSGFCWLEAAILSGSWFGATRRRQPLNYLKQALAESPMSACSTSSWRFIANVDHMMDCWSKNGHRRTRAPVIPAVDEAECQRSLRRERRLLVPAFHFASPA